MTLPPIPFSAIGLTLGFAGVGVIFSRLSNRARVSYNATSPDLGNRPLDELRDKEVKFRRLTHILALVSLLPLVFELDSVLADAVVRGASILGGALAVAVLLYVLKRAGSSPLKDAFESLDISLLAEVEVAVLGAASFIAAYGIVIMAVSPQLRGELLSRIGK